MNQAQRTKNLKRLVSDNWFRGDGVLSYLSLTIPSRDVKVAPNAAEKRL